MANNETKRQITIIGLITHYGSYRAKTCAGFLYHNLPELYSKPEVELLHDLEFRARLEGLRTQVSKVNRRLWSIRHPVVVFFNQRYVGDHRALVEYVIREHQLVPDLPFVHVFPDLKKILPQKKGKDYVFLEVRIGTLSGQMVFELDTDVCPVTCNFFMKLCQSKPEQKIGDRGPRKGECFVGSKFRRIYGRSLVQGGQIPGCDVTIGDENYHIQHDRRGLLSLANGASGSTTEFCISFKENPWMDGVNVAFGRLIFGEHLLAAIEKVPTYYQTPLTDIDIVGAGIIPRTAELEYSKFKKHIDKEKEKLNKEFTELEQKRISDIKKLEEIVKNYVTYTRDDEPIEYGYHYKGSQTQAKIVSARLDKSWEDGEVFNESDSFDEVSFGGGKGDSLGGETSEQKLWEEDENPSKINWLQGESDKISSSKAEATTESEDEEISEISDVDQDEIKDWMLPDDQLAAESALLGEDSEEWMSAMQKKKFRSVLKDDFTLEELMDIARKENVAEKRQLIIELILSILRAVVGDDIPPTPPPSEEEDTLDVREVPSDHMTRERLELGLYSLPGAIQHELVKTFHNLSPGYFTRLHSAVSSLLRESVESEEEVEEILSRVGSEGIISGILISVWNATRDSTDKVDENFVYEAFDNFIALMKASHLTAAQYFSDVKDRSPSIVSQKVLFLGPPGPRFSQVRTSNIRRSWVTSKLSRSSIEKEMSKIHGSSKGVTEEEGGESSHSPASEYTEEAEASTEGSSQFFSEA